MFLYVGILLRLVLLQFMAPARTKPAIHLPSDTGQTFAKRLQGSQLEFRGSPQRLAGLQVGHRFFAKASRFSEIAGPVLVVFCQFKSHKEVAWMLLKNQEERVLDTLPIAQPFCRMRDQLKAPCAAVRASESLRLFSNSSVNW